MIRFTESNIGWKIDGNPTAPIAELRKKVTAMISKKYTGNRLEAIKSSIENLEKNGITLGNIEDKYELSTWNDFALIAEALRMKEIKILELIPELAYKKRVNQYEYNVILKKFIAGL